MTNTLSNISWLFMTGVLIIVSLLLMSFVLSSTETDRVQAEESSPVKNKIMNTDSPNIVTSGVAKTVNGMAGFMDSAGYALSGGIQSAASTTAQVGKSVASGVQTGAVTVGRGVGSGLALVGNTAGKSVGMMSYTGKSVLFVISIPGNALESVASASVGSLIRPADHEEVPIIDPNSVELKTAVAALPPSKSADQTAPQSDQGPQWPMHGRVTTEFGVDHWPFQHTHTGIDISNGRGAEIKPFRPGRVIETVHSNRGLGNHVIVDHSNGVVSVYAHLASISVNEGQAVDLGTTLGLEGTTGVSTGNHLHFEIRVHGQAADPRKFIDGQP